MNRMLKIMARVLTWAACITAGLALGKLSTMDSLESARLILRGIDLIIRPALMFAVIWLGGRVISDTALDFKEIILPDIREFAREWYIKNRKQSGQSNTNGRKKK